MANYTSMYASGQAVDQALQRGEEAWTKINSGEVGGGKIEMLYNGTNITVDGAVVNFKQIVDYLTVDNKFTYLLYNNMAYLTTKIDTTSSLKQVVFESSHVDGGMGKIFTITVNSSDGVAIASINHTNVANENYSNKVGSIAENDKKSTVHYPSNKAVTDITDMLENNITQLGQSLVTVQGDVSKLTETVARIEEDIAKEMLDGTPETYHKAMRNWFYEHGVGVTTPQGITNLVNQWYALTRDNWDGRTVFSQPGVSTSSDGTKSGDNANLTCIPSTDTQANRDDYAGLPLFAVSTVNWILDENGNPLITAIKGIHDTYEQYNPDKYVGVMQMTGYTYTEESDTTYTIGYTANKNAEHAGLKPLPEAVGVDGTVREFVLHSKYMSKTVNGKMTSCSGLIPTAWMSHNVLITLPNNNGSKYSGSTVIDQSFLVLMTMIKYGSMTQDGRIQGCLDYNIQSYVQVAESDTQRVLLPDSVKNQFIVGSSVIIGTYNGSSADRNTASNYDISTNTGCLITDIETVNIDGTNYTALYVDLQPFTTTANGTAQNGTTIVSTWHWKTGTNDKVLGNDGSIVSASNGKYPAMIQGIEYSVGCYEVYSDVILNIANGNYIPYLTKLKQHQATSITSNMTPSSLVSPQPTSDSWNYIKKLSYDGEIFFGTDTTGATSSTYTRDGFYKNGTATTTGTRVWLAFGHLLTGVGYGGLSFLPGGYALSLAYWGFGARLSCNGNRA